QNKELAAGPDSRLVHTERSHFGRRPAIRAVMSFNVSCTPCEDIGVGRVRLVLGGSGLHAIKRAMALLEWLIVAAAVFGGLVALRRRPRQRDKGVRGAAIIYGGRGERLFQSACWHRRHTGSVINKVYWCVVCRV